MDPNYRYKGARLKPKIAKAIILEQFAGQTMSRREIDAGVIQHHQSNGGLPSTAKTNPIKAALRYLKGKGLAENVSRGSGSTWRIFESPRPVSEPLDTETLITVIRAEVEYLRTLMESFEHRISELEAVLTKEG